MNNTFNALFVIFVLIFAGCGSEYTNLVPEIIPKSNAMPDFIMPLSQGNFWEFIEYRKFYNGDSTFRYDTATYKLSIQSTNNLNWDELNEKLETYEVISNKIEHGRYDAPAIFGVGYPGIQIVLAKNADTLKISQAAFNNVQEGNNYYPTETVSELSINKWTPAGIKLKQTYKNVTYDTVYVWRIPKNENFTSEYHFVKGIGLVYWEEFYKPGGFYNLKGYLKSYSVE
jgi:hypothetical protein